MARESEGPKTTGIEGDIKIRKLESEMSTRHGFQSVFSVKKIVHALTFHQST